MAQDMTATAKQELDATQAGEPTRPGVLYCPDVDIYETEDRVVVVADMPGVAPGDIDVTLERNVLTIYGRGGKHAHEGYRRIYREYREGDFERAFTLSESVDRERIKATHKDGVLTLELPKAETAKTRKIDVKAT